MQHDTLTVAQAATALGFSRITVLSWIRQGRLVPVSGGRRGRGNGYRLRRADVDAFTPPSARLGRADEERRALALGRKWLGLPPDASAHDVGVAALLRILERQMTRAGMVPARTE